MMREVGGEENNGESTFEFVDQKLENLQLNEDGTVRGDNRSGNLVPPATPSNLMPAIPSPMPPVTSFFSPLIAPSGDMIPSPVPISTLAQPAPNILPPFHPSAPPPSIPYPVANTSLVSSPYAQGRVSASVTAPNFVAPISNPIPTAPQAASYSNFPPPNQYSFSGPVSSTIQSSQPGSSAGIKVEPFSPQPNMSLDMPFVEIGSTNNYDKPLMSPSADAGGGLIGWIKDTVSGSDLLSKFAEKAKNSVDTMITTLDPQMKEYMNSGGEIDLIIVSENDEEVSAIREAIQHIFGRATVRGRGAPAQFAPQLMGFNSALGSGDARIKYLRTGGYIDPQQPAISIESFLAELHADKWYEMTALVLRDPYRNLALQSFTIPIPIENAFVCEAKNLSSDRYELSWSGIQTPVGDLISRSYGAQDWRYSLSGTTLKERITMAARSLAISYKNNINAPQADNVLRS